MSKTIRELAAEKAAEIEAARQRAREVWLANTFGLTIKSFESEGMTIKLGAIPHNAGLQIKLADDMWSDVIVDWEDLHDFFEGRSYSSFIDPYTVKAERE